MKKWYLLAGLVVAYLVWRWVKAKRAADAGAATADARDAAIVAAVQAAMAPGTPGVYANPDRTWAYADQSVHPGFLVSSDGYWINPETGESYSPGSSPIVLGQRTEPEITIDLNNGFNFAAAGTDTSLGGSDIIY